MRSKRYCVSDVNHVPQYLRGKKWATTIEGEPTESRCGVTWRNKNEWQPIWPSRSFQSAASPGTGLVVALSFQRPPLYPFLRFSIFLPMWKTLMIPLQNTLKWSSNSLLFALSAEFTSQLSLIAIAYVEQKEKARVLDILNCYDTFNRQVRL